MTVQGAARLQKKLHQLPAAYQQEIFKAMEMGAEATASMARGLVPVDTGTLRRSINWTWGDAPEGSMVLSDKEAPKGAEVGAIEKITVYAGGPDAYYARWVEFGTVNQPAQPYFYPAWRSSKKKVLSRNKSAMNKVARKVAAGGN